MTISFLSAFVTLVYVISNILPVHVLVPLVAVSQEGVGLLTNLTIEQRAGNNRILTEINPPIGRDTQESITNAISVSRNYTNTPTIGKDIIFDFHANAKSVTGPSAGLPIALGIISLLSNKKLDRSVVATGEIDDQGNVFAVGGLVEKLEAMHNRYSRLIIPRRQQIVYGALAAVHLVDINESSGHNIIFLDTFGGYDLSSYALKKYGVEIFPVKNIDEAVDIAFGKKRYVDNRLTVVKTTPAPEEILRDIAMQELFRVKQELKAMGKNNSIGFISQLKTAELYFNNSFYYPAASEAFKIMIDIKTFQARRLMYNMTEKERRRFLINKIKELQVKILEISKKVSYMSYPELKIELIVCSQQRLFWAEYFLDKAIKELGKSVKVPINSDMFLFYIYGADEWIAGAEIFSEVSERIGGQGYIDYSLVDYCKERVEDARIAIINAQNAGLTNLVGADRFYIASQIELQKGWVIAACFDAITAEETVKAVRDLIKIEDENIDIKKVIRRELSEFEPEHLWSYMNSEYARLSLEKLNKTSDMSLKIDALVFTRRAKALEELANFIEKPKEESDRFSEKSQIIYEKPAVITLFINFIFLFIGVLMLRGDLYGRIGSSEDKESRDK